MAEVIFDDITKVYPGGVRALSGFSLTVHDGERVVLVGPSGSGKTTILRLLAGLETPTGGTMRIGSRVVNALPPHARHVALVFQRPTFYPHLCVRDNLAFGLRMQSGWGPLARLFQRLLHPEAYRKTAADVAERVADAAHLLQLDDVLDRRPQHLSGGQQQRVALGRALVRRPSVFLLDEPLSNLEPRLRIDLRRELHLLQQRFHATMIYVTHDQSEALTFGDRVVVLDRGVVQQVDRPEVLYERPANRFVAGFIGWPPMNFFRARVDEERLVLDDCSLALPPGLLLDYGRPPGGVVEVGIRPEHLRRSPCPEPGSLTMTVELAEPLGGEVLLTCRRGVIRITARLAADEAAASADEVEIGFDMSKLYFFDASGKALFVRTG